MSGASGDKATKTEKATPKKVADARKQGQVAKSQEVAAWTSMLAISMLVPWTMSRGARTFRGLLGQLPELISDPELSRAIAFLGGSLRAGVLLVLPLSVALMLVGVGAGAAQVGLKPTPKALKPKFSRLNPLTGLKRLFGAQTAWASIKELLKLAILAGVAWRSLSGAVEALLSAGTLPIMTVVATTWAAAAGLLRNAAFIGLLLAAADFAVQKQQLGKQLRMSKQEIKDENKQADGDPQLKGAIRQRQFALSRNRMMADIATADVVLVNPTHVAVALRYRPDRGAPQVVAKGAGAVAARIRERAGQERIPLVRDVPLARAVYAACEIGESVPAELYGAVAQVLAFVFGLRARGSAAGTHTVPQPALH